MRSDITRADRPFVGRETQLKAIEVATCRTNGALLIGDSGVGKSSLLRAALDRAARSGAIVTRLNGAGGPTHGALTEQLDRHPGPGERRVVGVDDAHLVDPHTAARLYGLVCDGRASVLAAIPARAQAPDAINRLWVEKLIERLEIGAFDRSDVAKVLTARLGGHVAADTLERFWELTLGNAFMLQELTDHALTEGSLRRVGDSWQWPGLTGKLDGRLADLAQLLLGELAPDECELVDLVALAGSLEVDLPVVAELSDAAEALNRRGILVVERENLRLRLRLAHPICGPATVSSLPVLTARRLRLRIADAIERTGARRRDDMARIVALRLDAGRIPDGAQLRTAARTALRRQDFALAERLCRLTGAADDGTALAVALPLGQALAGQHRHLEAETLFARLPNTGAVSAESAAALRDRVLNLVFGLQRIADAEAIVDEAVAAVGADGHGTFLGAWALVRLLADRLDDVLVFSEAVSAQPPGSFVAQQALPVLAFARNELGDTDGALTLLRNFPPALDTWDDEARLLHRVVLARAVLQAGGPAAAADLLDRPWDYEAEDDPRYRLHIALLKAQSYRSSGRPAEAVDLLRQAAAHQGPGDWLTTKAWTLAQLAGALAEAGENTEAMRTLVEARSAHESTVPYSLVSDAMAMERALVLAHVGDHADAVRQALKVADSAGAAGRRTQALSALHLAARLGTATEAVDRLSGMSGPAGSGFAVLQESHIRALAANDGDALAAVSVRFAALELLPLAAEASAQACRAQQAAGRHRKSRAARAASRNLLARYDSALPGWAALGPSQDCGFRAELTIRELEVAALAAARLSNREIADRLVVSVRTVENHLHRAYGKLGVATRAELTHHLGFRSTSSDRESL
ncbi:LuxR C-terminal-related transcriptional regulator [Streptomyces sp. NPDC004647]|uniref:LuxR C-terminal-related transcriptional regulator n=1 Tax=Streptomyces sp. NPDC004647 TaxID=3154671 RepID=UPI0033AEE208